MMGGKKAASHWGHASSSSRERKAATQKAAARSQNQNLAAGRAKEPRRSFPVASTKAAWYPARSACRITSRGRMKPWTVSFPLAKLRWALLTPSSSLTARSHCPAQSAHVSPLMEKSNPSASASPLAILGASHFPTRATALHGPSALRRESGGRPARQGPERPCPQAG